jgi:hypothetical protein
MDVGSGVWPVSMENNSPGYSDRIVDVNREEECALCGHVTLRIVVIRAWMEPQILFRRVIVTVCGCGRREEYDLTWPMKI